MGYSLCRENDFKPFSIFKVVVFQGKLKIVTHSGKRLQRISLFCFVLFFFLDGIVMWLLMGIMPSGKHLLLIAIAQHAYRLYSFPFFAYSRMSPIDHGPLSELEYFLCIDTGFKEANQLI